MTLQVRIPEKFYSENQWVISVLLENFLGLDVNYITSSGGPISIEAEGKQFLSTSSTFPSHSNLLSEIRLPKGQPPLWDTRTTGLPMHLLNPEVPVLSGNPSAEICPDKITLNWDIFGSTFLLLSRYEETIIPNYDSHGRVPFEETMEGRFGLVTRPLVDEYLEILWSCFKTLWPQMVRQPRSFEMDISCDLDHIYCPSSFHISNLLRRIGSDIFLYRSLPQALTHLQNFQATRRGNHDKDPFLNAIHTMMDINEAAGNRISFNIKPLSSHPVYDAPIDLDDPTVRHLLRSIFNRGHQIGFHPGYLTYDNGENFETELAKLRQVLEQEKIDAKVSGGRQHYLRWRTPDTAQIWEKAEMEYDSTLGFTQHAGFRCGTSRRFCMYDLQNRQPMKLVQRPLVLMEVSVIAKQYMGLGRTPAALKVMEDLKNICQFYGGCFSLLWHNSQMRTAWDFQTYERLCNPASS